MNKQHFYKKLTALVLGGLMSFTAGTVSAANTVQLNLEDAVKGMSVPFHAGAKKYYEEQGITVE